MQILVLHLSDIHIREENDPVLGRVEHIVSAVRDLASDPDVCLLALSGDIANSGLAEQYELASAWLSALCGSLSIVFRPSTRVLVAVVPGNHDCALHEVSPARAVLIDAMLREPHLADDPATAAICVQPQQSFFRFRDAIAAEGLSDATPRLYYEYLVEGSSGRLCIRCLNTAWVSQIPEQPTRLMFPESSIEPAAPASSDPRDTVVISMMHHTYNWLAIGNTRVVRRQLQSTSDFILTGHEHEFGVSHLLDELGGEAVHIEGVALQGDGHPRPSAFNILEINSAGQEYRVIPFQWHRTAYVGDLNCATASWSAFSVNPLRAGHAFPLTPTMRQRLVDPGTTLLHPTRGQLALDDIFVYPDLREVTAAPVETRAKVHPGEDLLDLAIDRKRILITGSDESGKTVLAKRMFLAALDAGLVPIFLDGSHLTLEGDDHDRREVARAFADQYVAEEAGLWEVSMDKRILLVDDASSISASSIGVSAAIDRLSRLADTTVLFSNDLAQLVNQIAGIVPSLRGGTPFAQFRLLPMGFVRREELIDRYVVMADVVDAAAADELRADMRRILGVAVGQYGAPPTPVSVIAILQGRAFQESLNLQQSTYGYYYDLLIRRQLVGLGATIQQIDVQLAYLTQLAFEAAEERMVRWTEAWMMAFHQRFVDDRRLPMGFRNLVDAFIKRGILQEANGEIAFRYDYLNNYFASRALAERIGSEVGRARVRELTRHLHEQESANTLLFLTHHTKDPAVLDPMLEQAATLFAESLPADLSTGSTRLPQLEEALASVAYVDRSSADGRREYLTALDREDLDSIGGSDVATERLDARRIERDAALQSVVDVMTRLSVAFRTMKILGQVLKNFPGTLTGDQKDRITRAVYGVGRRVLGYVHKLLQDSPHELAEEVVAAVRHRHPELSGNDLVLAAQNAAYWQIYITAYSMVQRTASDVGTPLLDPVFSDIAKLSPLPAVELITMAIRLQRAAGLSEPEVRSLYDRLDRNGLGQRVLRSLVVTHLHLFDVRREVRQSICSQLNIPFVPLLPDAPTRMLGPGRK